MKEWKKPLVKVVVVEEDVIATSETQTQEISIDDGTYKDQSTGNIWGR